MTPIEQARAYWRGVSAARIYVGVGDYDRADAALRHIQTLANATHWLRPHAKREAEHLVRMIGEMEQRT